MTTILLDYTSTKKWILAQLTHDEWRSIGCKARKAASICPKLYTLALAELLKTNTIIGEGEWRKMTYKINTLETMETIMDDIDSDDDLGIHEMVGVIVDYTLDIPESHRISLNVPLAYFIAFHTNYNDDCDDTVHNRTLLIQEISDKYPQLLDDYTESEQELNEYKLSLVEDDFYFVNAGMFWKSALKACRKAVVPETSDKPTAIEIENGVDIIELIAICDFAEMNGLSGLHPDPHKVAIAYVLNKTLNWKFTDCPKERRKIIRKARKEYPDLFEHESDARLAGDDDLFALAA